jgi:hypothetical protein
VPQNLAQCFYLAARIFGRLHFKQKHRHQDSKVLITVFAGFRKHRHQRFERVVHIEKMIVDAHGNTGNVESASAAPKRCKYGDSFLAIFSRQTGSDFQFSRLRTAWSRSSFEIGARAASSAACSCGISNCEMKPCTSRWLCSAMRRRDKIRWQRTAGARRRRQRLSTEIDKQIFSLERPTANLAAADDTPGSGERLVGNAGATLTARLLNVGLH